MDKRRQDITNGNSKKAQATAARGANGKTAKTRESQTEKTVSGNRSEPMLNQRGKEIQAYGERFHVPVGLEEKTIEKSILALNTVLADTMFIRDMYKKHHWQMSGATFYPLHLLLDKHYEAQAELVDMIAERIQSYGGISLAMPNDVAEMTNIEHPPRGREEVPVQISRLIEAHEIILKESRKFAKQADDMGDDGTNDLFVSNIIRTNEAQVWFLSEHLVGLPMVVADEEVEEAELPEDRPGRARAATTTAKSSGGGKARRRSQLM